MHYRTINPTTEKQLAEFAACTAAQIDVALTRAATAAAPWVTAPVSVRIDALRAIATQLLVDRDRLAALITLEMGKPITESRAEIEKCALVCRHYADHGAELLAPTPVATEAAQSYIQLDPLGTILGIMPWNFPFWQVFRFAVPPLLIGNTILVKHAPYVPQCAEAIAEIFHRANLPAGIYQNLFATHAQVADLIAAPQIASVSVTGSPRAGRAIAALAGAALKPIVMELGGSDPCILLADADLDQAIPTALRARMINSGQSCIAAKRIIVETPLYDTVVERLCVACGQLAVGDPTVETTQIGPLARADLRDTVADQVRRAVAAGAQCRVGGTTTTTRGFFFPPTLLTHVTPGNPAFDEEVFGPVLAVVRARDAADAVTLANHSSYGLGASLWTQDLERARHLASQLACGSVFINDLVRSDPRLPFGGVKASGYGRELGTFGLTAFANVKSVWVR